MKGLRNLDGEWCEGEDHVAGLFVDYHKNLFSFSNPVHVDDVLEATPQVVTMGNYWESLPDMKLIFPLNKCLP